MKKCIEKMFGAMKEYRQGDRVIMDNDINMKSEIYKRSKPGEPYVVFKVNGGFKLTVLEMVLIVAGLSAMCTLFLLSVKRKISAKFKKTKK